MVKAACCCLILLKDWRHWNSDLYYSELYYQAEQYYYNTDWLTRILSHTVCNVNLEVSHYVWLVSGYGLVLWGNALSLVMLL